MPADASALSSPLYMVWPFALLICRTGALVASASLPGLRGAVPAQRMTLAVLLAFLLAPFAQPCESPTLSASLVSAVSEVVLGIALGLAISLVLEGIQLGAHLISVQAGFAYASTVDPTSDADSAVLQVLYTLTASMTFFALGLDAIFFDFLLRGVIHLPPGSWSPKPRHATLLVDLFPPLFTDAIRFALPVLAALLLVDLCLALFSRLQPNLQLLTLSFPLKMLAAIAISAVVAPSFASAVERSTTRTFHALRSLLNA